MYIEMELLARERYESRLREMEDIHRTRRLVGPEHRTVRPARNRPLPRMRRG
jgi:hypothetical protein